MQLWPGPCGWQPTADTTCRRAGSPCEPLPRYPDRMKQVEYWRWWITDEVSGKRRKTRWRMTEQDATAHPGAERVAGSLEIRNCPETPEEMIRMTCASSALGPPGRAGPGL